MAAASCARRARAVQQQQPRHQAGQRLPGLLRQRPPDRRSRAARRGRRGEEVGLRNSAPRRPPAAAVSAASHGPLPDSGRGSSRRGRGRGIRQQPAEGGKRADVDPRPGRDDQGHAGLPLEHPGRHLEAPAAVPAEAAPQRGGAPSLAHLMDADGEAAPGMPRIQERPLRGPVGAQAPSCTTAYVRMPPSASGRPRRKWCWPPSPPGPRRYAGRPRQPHRSWRPGRR